MKKLFFLLSITALVSCADVKQIGKINMISNRNVDSGTRYKVISTYAGGSNRELKHSRAKNIQDAIDATVRKVPGGEYLMNASIYLIKGKYYAVQGDVWGRDQEISFRGFKQGDKVQWKNSLISQGMGEKKYVTGTITSLKDDKTCYVQDESGKQREMSYDDISKVQ